MNLVKRILLAGAVITILGASSVIACRRDYNITPTEPIPITTPAQSPTPTLDNIVTPTPDATTIPKPTPTLEATVTPEITGPYRLYAPTATLEEFKNFNSALDKAWGIVKDVYGINPSEPIAVVIAEKKQGYWIELNDKARKMGIDFNKPVSDSGSYTIRDFLANQEKERGIKHELAHRFNESLFPTKNNIEPWYNTFDEGSAMYASGEVTSITSLINHEKWGPQLKVRLDELRSNPEAYWKNREVGNPGHATGSDLYTLLVLDYGLTPEKNTIAMKILARYYKEPGTRTNREMIQSAYETAIGTNLSKLFDSIETGIKMLYNASSSK